MPMTAQQRAEIREEILVLLKAKCDAAGGDITDGVAIVGTLASHLSASLAVDCGVPMELGRADLVKVIRLGYPASYKQLKAAHDGMVASASRH